jgi:hypothetical protein
VEEKKSHVAAVDAPGMADSRKRISGEMPGIWPSGYPFVPASRKCPYRTPSPYVAPNEKEYSHARDDYRE